MNDKILWIEGVNVDQSRIRTVVLKKTLLDDRDEEEVRCYRDALAGERERCGRKEVIPLKRGNKRGNNEGAWHRHLISGFFDV